MAAAARWLLGGDPALSSARVRGLIRFQGLIPLSPRFDGPGLLRAVRLAGRSRPMDGVVLAGLGEMAANMHEDILSALSGELARLRPPIDVFALLETASGALVLTSAPTRRAAFGRVSDEPLDPHRLAATRRALDAPYEVATRDYGFTFALSVAFALDPRRAVQWLDANRSPRVVRATNAELSEALTFGGRAPALTQALLGSRQPGLQAFGAAAALQTAADDEFGPGIRAVAEILRAGGQQPEEVLWVSADLLRDRCHRINRWRERIVGARSERARLVGAPAPAVGHLRNEKSRIEGLDEQIGELRAELTKMETAWSAEVEELAAIWPRSPIAERTRAFVDSALGGEGGARLDVAAALPEGADRDAMLEANLDSFRDRLGLSGQTVVFKDYFPEVNSEGLDLSAAAAAALMAKAGASGIGRQTSLLLMPLARDATAFLDTPFALGRFPAGWQGCLSRFALGLCLVFDVELQPEAKDADLRKLVEMALNHAETLLAHAGAARATGRHLGSLVLRAVLSMAANPAHDRRRAWAVDARFDDLTRALARWSDPEAVKADIQGSVALFELAARPHLHAHGRNPGGNDLATLTDVAVSAARDQGWAAGLRWVRRRVRTAATELALDQHFLDHLGVLTGAGLGEPHALATLRANPGFDGRVLRRQIDLEGLG